MKDFKVSLVVGLKGHIVGYSTFFEVLKKCTKDESLTTNAKKLRTAAKSSAEEYKRLKLNQPGFIIGEFSYRKKENLTNYCPVMGFDFDSLGDRFDEIYTKLKCWPFTGALTPSISGDGIRLLVETDSTAEGHAEAYRSICEDVSAITNVKLRSEMKKSFISGGLSSEEAELIIKKKPHIDDVTNDFSRFWFYSGLSRSEIFINNESKTYTEEEKPKAPVATPINKRKKSNLSSYDWSPTEAQKVEFCLELLERGRIDITSGFSQWHKIGQAIYSEFKPSGEDYFQRACAMHPDYKETECSSEWRRITTDHKIQGATIASFYESCKEHGVAVDYKELRRRHGPAGRVRKTTALIDDFVIEPLHLAETEEEKSIHEAERCVLATAIMQKDFIGDIFDEIPKFGSYCFSNPLYKRVFEVIESLRADGRDVNPAAIVAKSGHTDYPLTMEDVSSIAGRKYYPSSVGTNAALVFDSFQRSMLSEVAASIQARISTGEPIGDLISGVESSLSRVSDTGDSTTEAGMDEVVNEVIDRLKTTIENRKKGITLTGITTGKPGLDRLFGGRQKGHLYIKAGRPGMGKTMDLVSEANAAAMAGFSVGILTLEMPKLELGQRLLSGRSGVPLTRITTGEISDSGFYDLIEQTNTMGGLPIRIDDKGGPSLAYFKRQIRKWKRLYSLDIAFIDYLQLADLGDGKTTTNDKVGAITKGLKQLAKSEEIPIVLLSQLNRAVETRGGDKKPQLSDLRDSGNIEQDADGVEFLYRPEYYGIEEDEQGNSLAGMITHLVKKNRHGACGEVFSRVDLPCQRILPLEDKDLDLLSSAVDRHNQKKAIPAPREKRQPVKMEVVKMTLKEEDPDSLESLRLEFPKEEIKPPVYGTHQSMQQAIGGSSFDKDGEDLPF